MTSDFLNRPPITPEARERFERLAKQWRAETAHFSDTRRIMGNPAIREIIEMGEVVLPLIMKELEAQSGLWCWVVPLIANEKLFTPEMAGKIRLQSERCLEWGREKGYR